MAEKTQVTIVGLGLIGASAGLALRRYSDRVTVVGHDRNGSAAGQAKSMGAVDRTDWNLINAVRNADRILLATPINEVHDTLEVIREDLKSECVILDTSSTKAAVLQWAAEFLPANVHLVGGHPIVVTDYWDTGSARADLFQDKLFCLSSDSRTSSSALQLATDLVEALGARPFFVDAAEHDGLVAAVDHLPMVMAAALARAVSESASWQEMRKLAGSQFYAGSFQVEPDVAGAARTVLANREKHDPLARQLRRRDGTMASAPGRGRSGGADPGFRPGDHGYPPLGPCTRNGQLGRDSCGGNPGHGQPVPAHVRVRRARAQEANQARRKEKVAFRLDAAPPAQGGFGTVALLIKDREIDAEPVGRQPGGLLPGAARAIPGDGG